MRHQHNIVSEQVSPAPMEGFIEELRPLLKKWQPMLSPQDLLEGTAEAAHDLWPSAERAVTSARLRGLGVREQLKLEEGGHVSAEEARRFFHNQSKTTLLKHHKAGKLIGWKEGRAFRFPVWQFAEGGGLLPGMEEVLRILAQSPVMDDWGRLLFFLTPRESLSGKRPLDCIREGHPEEASRLAYGELE